MNTQFNKESMVTSLEWLKEATEMAFEKQAEPVYAQVAIETKAETHLKTNCYRTFEHQDYVYDSDLNQYDKAVILYMYHFYPLSRTTVDIAQACSISLGSVKRVLARFMKSEHIMRAPFEPGYMLTEFKGNEGTKTKQKN